VPSLRLPEGEGGRRVVLLEAAAPADIEFEPNDAELLGGAVHATPSGLAAFRLSLRAAALAAQPGLDRLLCLPMVRDMDVLDHQVTTARQVLRRMRGRALLCDEVGLGKTVEAGLVLAELMLRGLVRSVLVLVPPSLVEQWQAELRRKFSIDVVAHDDAAFRAEGSSAWGRHDRVLASYHTAKRATHRAAIAQRNWDMVIVDEAHHLRNRTTELWKLVSEIPKRYVLLLTATPVQNNLEELFNLVTLLEPGLLSTARQFTRRFVDGTDRLTPRNIDRLHELLSEVMVRNQRDAVGLQFTRRWARTERVAPSPDERRLYDEVARFVREHLRGSTEGRALSRVALVTLQMELGSSARASAATLGKLAGNEGLEGGQRERLADLARLAGATGDCTKADRLLALLRELPDKLVVFTQFRATQDMLRERLEQAGICAAVFHGGLARMEKERQVRRFRDEVRVLIATDSGSEGRNLQFCNAICNFDLPWNPMRIEQRIGRLSRIGQHRDVHVFNLVAAGTIESAILHLLEAKLAMFEMVIGEIDMVLGNLDDDGDFAEVVTDLWSRSEGFEDFSRRMEDLGERMLAARAAYFEQRAVERRLFGDRLAAREEAPPAADAGGAP
jgi:SNF2 family DNA or RNA helicase